MLPNQNNETIHFIVLTFFIDHQFFFLEERFFRKRNNSMEMQAWIKTNGRKVLPRQNQWKIIKKRGEHKNSNPQKYN